MAIQYSNVVSRDDALRLIETGDLVTMLLLPDIFGGDGRRENVVVVPQSTADEKRNLDLITIRDLIVQGKVTCYEAAPSFVGSSVVPSFITVKVHDPEYFVFVINIWSEESRS